MKDSFITLGCVFEVVYTKLIKWRILGHSNRRSRCNPWYVDAGIVCKKAFTISVESQSNGTEVNKISTQVTDKWQINHQPFIEIGVTGGLLGITAINKVLFISLLNCMVWDTVDIGMITG